MKEVGRMKTKELNKGEIIITSQDLHKTIYEFFKRILDVMFGCGSDCSFPCFSGNGIGGKK